MADASTPRKGGALGTILVLVFAMGVLGLTYLLSGRFLSGKGVSWAMGVGIGAGIACLLVTGILEKVKAPSLAAPVLLLIGAGAAFWFLALPVLRHPDTNYGYSGTYQVTYSDGRTETMDGAVLNEQEWSKRAGGYMALALAPACFAVGVLAGSLRKKPAA
ncbi:MAG TPA: hypothetical protein VE825_09285 [Terriglobales bacterium]|nr:hypothetical protein [Terriglobales bacterium]